MMILFILVQLLIPQTPTGSNYLIKLHLSELTTYSSGDLRNKKSQDIIIFLFLRILKF